MFYEVQLLLIAELMMKRKNNYPEYDWTSDCSKPVQHKLPVVDRIIDSTGEALISVGNRLKQHSHARLTTEQAQAPNFIIML